MRHCSPASRCCASSPTPHRWCGLRRRGLDLFAVGGRGRAQREAIAKAIGPIWEANHVWLIIVIVILFVGFPKTYATIGTALHVPLTLTLVGIVLRGTAFVFRHYDSRRDRVQLQWSLVFAVAPC